MGGDTTLYQHLQKLSTTINSEEAVDHILSSLWKTRRTGLRPPDKSHIQTLLGLPSLSELDPVLACLRSLIRKFVHDNLSGDDLLKLFPPDLPLELQSVLVFSFDKYRSQWKDDLSREQTLPGTSVFCQVRTSVPPSLTSLPSSSEISAPLCPRQGDAVNRLNGCGNDFGVSAASGLQRDAVHADNPGSLPRVKSMTWTIENHDSAPTNKVAIIRLKLQDYSKSHLGEMEVKFQLTRDTLEAMLKSMTYISEQLSRMVSSFCIMITMISWRTNSSTVESSCHIS
ncbi:Protein FAR1-RELATED SEQUENCE 3 [Morella rubra]|uniref:Protein FAR1-RELATED SEQUENCE 3 n=1 Tax=Morella rubra TaxID=262757 RepID=A0A6A1WCT9_9ROSI|nr:Protein FAR1-RELATED SEQUENCE 3 [Morella rubra]